MTGRFEGKVVLVTGGGSGIGRAAVLDYVKEGAKVAIADINKENGEETLGLVREAGGEGIFIETDVTEADQVKNMVQKTVETYGHLDCACNNAGIEGRLVPLIEQDDDDFDQVMRVNVRSVFLCMKYQVPVMLGQGGGSIVNVASVAGIKGVPKGSPYSASKHAVLGLTKSAAVEYVRKNVRINAICPSFIETSMVERSKEQQPEFIEKMRSFNPTKRFGTAEEVSQAILWITSDDASYVNGHSMVIDGGLSVM